MVLLIYGVIDFYIGFLAGVKSFTAAVLGGVGSLPGAMLGGVVLGHAIHAHDMLMHLGGAVRARRDHPRAELHLAVGERGTVLDDEDLSGPALAVHGAEVKPDVPHPGGSR